ncbi:MAG: hypothetical protein HRU34_00260 [Richelia sp.]|nr:hypothetical protein [Richelia sp.]CDN10874.1 hypothetical protein RintRC_2253 [Richelia intracellularis]
MGKYDRIFKSDNLSVEKLTPEESVAAIAIVTAAADKSLTQIELEFLVDTIWGFEIFEQYSDASLLAMLEKLVMIANAEGLGAVFNAAYESLTDELILDGFAAGVSVMVDDSTENIYIPKEKMPLVKNLQSALDVEDDEAQEVIDDVIFAFEEAEEFDDDILNLEIYESPLGNFTVAVPVDVEEGARVNAQEGLVSFSDDYGTLLRIDYYPLPPEQMTEIEAKGKEEYFRSVLLEKYVPQAITANLATATVNYTEYLADVMGGAFFAVVDMPGGSTISKTSNNGSASRLNAHRGLLSFIKNNFFYVLTSQHTFFPEDIRGDITEEMEDIKEDIFYFLDSIEFA